MALSEDYLQEVARFDLILSEKMRAGTNRLDYPDFCQDSVSETRELSAIEIQKLEDWIHGKTPLS